MLQSKDSQIKSYKNVLDANNKLLDNKNLQYELLEKEREAEIEDMNFVKSELKIYKKRVKIIKVGIFVISGVAIFTDGWLIYQYIKK